MKNMMMKMLVFAGCMLTFVTTELTASPGSVVGKTVFKTAIEAGAKRSGKALTPALRAAAEEALSKAVLKYGDNAAIAVRKGGLEALEAGAKHGDDFWRICAGVSDDAALVLARNADEFLPVVKRIGPEFLELEAHAHGLGKRVVATFGEQSVKTVSRVPKKDVSRLLGYAERAESPEVARQLLEKYEATGGKILDHLNWKHIMATGLSAAMVVSAYKVSNGVVEVIKTNPEVIADIASIVTSPVCYGLYALFAILLLPVYSLCRRLQKWVQAKPEKNAGKTASEAEPEEDPAQNQKNL